ncbi:[histone H3]-dimethyl-L-lysine(36) demethylase [Malassezia equina]|uniref:[histone H3]-dimethyl-L-lysine(36) demethylase n=1 Tax=Malassezia equina TaxID=1381935 RepID=A0AAF0EAL2_9BASI|nr:[histone H3]-dimethyl-L-lysine(36) demethylase [Malassezia equina]
MAPHLMTPAMVNALARVSLQAGQLATARDPFPLQRATLLLAPRFSMENPARSLARISHSIWQFAGLGKGGRIGAGRERVPVTSMDIGVLEESQRILESAGEDLDLSLDTDVLDNAVIGDEAVPVSLLRGYEATVPQASAGKARRRQVRATQSARRRRKEQHLLSLEELEAQDREVQEEMRNLEIRRALYHSEMVHVDAKIAALEATKAHLQQHLLQVREEELELEDEQQGLSELLELQRHRRAMPGGRGLDVTTVLPTGSSRRWKGPVFLPSEHDELPPHVAFMTLSCHTGPITALDLSEPYGTLISAALDDAVRVWDLSTGEDVGRLRGHTDTVKCLQVEDELCVSGSLDSSCRMWDLRRVDAFEAACSARIDGHEIEAENPCVRTLEGHSRGITALYFDTHTLVTGAADKTLRQWDLETGQCVLTMDILWAMSNAGTPALDRPAAQGFSSAPDALGRNTSQFTGPFSYPMPPYEDGSWEMYTDFVGGVQFWNYALASGSGDGGVRLWDCTYTQLTTVRTGQAHRTLLGHTAPVTCLQFDETHLVSGSLDRTIRIWDLRTGRVCETLSYAHPVTALQFDSRKILSAVGTCGLDVFNRTSEKHTTLATHGHTAPAERVRYMDRYALSGGRDSCIKVWSL